MNGARFMDRESSNQLPGSGALLHANEVLKVVGWMFADGTENSTVMS